MKMIKRILCLAIALVLAFSMFACEKDGGEASEGTAAESTPGQVNREGAVNVAIEVKDFGTIKLALYPGEAPITVENFLAYVKDGFYDGLTFHRIYKNFMIQGGDPEVTGSGGQSLKTIKGEFSANGVENDLSHKRGVISMARLGNNMDSASSQFFICDADSVSLDGQYAAFGEVTEGLDVLDAIASVEVQYNAYGEKSDPVNPVYIEKVYVIE